MAISSIIIFAYIALQSIKKSPVDLNEAQIDQNHHTFAALGPDEKEKA